MSNWKKHFSTAIGCSLGVSNIWAMVQGQLDECSNLVYQMNLETMFKIKIILWIIIKLQDWERKLVIHR